MKRFVAIGVWGLMLGVVGLFLITQVIAQSPRTAPPSATAKNPAPASPGAAKVPTQRAKQPAGQRTAAQPTQRTAASGQAPATRTPAAAAGSTGGSTQSRDLPPLLVGLYIFLLAIFVGFELISKVPPTLHTPLMSGANAISGITIVGALYCARHSSMSLASILGFLAVICAMINVVGGFLVTDRMLKMFRK